MYFLFLICAMAIGQDAKNQELVGLGMKGTINLDIPTGKIEEYQRAIRAADLDSRVKIKDGKATIDNPLATELERLRAIEEELLLPRLERVQRPFSIKPEKVAEFEQLLSKHLVRGSSHHTDEKTGAAFVCSTVAIVDAVEKDAKQRDLLSTTKEIKTIPLKHAKTEHLRFRLQTQEDADVYVMENSDINALLIHGDPAEIVRAEALVAKWDQPSDEKMIVKSIPVAEAKMEELKAVVTQLGLKEVRFGYDTEQKTAVVSATANEVEQVEKLVQEKSFAPSPVEVKVFRLNYVDSIDLATQLKSLGPAGVKISPDSQSKSIAVSGVQKDLKAIEALVKKLDRVDPSDWFRARIELKKGSWNNVIQAVDAIQFKGVNGNRVRFERVKEADREFLRIANIEDEEFEKIWTRLRELDLLKTEDKTLPKPDPTDEKITINAPPELTSRALRQFQQEKLDITISRNSELGMYQITGKSDAINRAEKILEEVRLERKSDEATGASGKSNTPASGKQIRVFQLQYSDATGIAATLNQLKMENVTIVPEERTNSVLVTGKSGDINVIEALLSLLDLSKAKRDPNESRKQDDRNPVIGTLWSDFAKAEAKSIETAGNLRAIRTRYGGDHPQVKVLTDQLKLAVELAFEFRHKLQQAEAAQLRRQLTEIETRLTKREKNKAAIIGARIDSLLNMDELGWEAMTKPKTANTEIANDLGSSNSDKAMAGDVGASSEADALWAQIQNKEYLEIQAREYPERQGGETRRGLQIQGIAFVPRALHRECLITIGAKSLPGRSLGDAPMYVRAFYNKRHPSSGVTELNSVAVDAQTAWAFVPGRRGSLTKVRVFTNPAPDMSFDSAVGFGIDAEGKIEQGGVVCSSSGEFLGLIAYHRGSLGICLSAPAIASWLERTTLEPAEYLKPTQASVLIALKGSRYIKQVDKENNRLLAIRESSFAGTIVKGVIVTHPAVADSDVQETGKVILDQQTLTIEKVKRTSDQRFTLIWCKEIKPEDGFQRTGKEPRQGDYVNCLDVIAEGWRDGYVSTPDLVWRMGEKYRDHRLVRQSGSAAFDIHWLGVRNAIGMGVVSDGGHFLGIGVSDGSVAIESTEQFEKLAREHSVQILPAQQILRIVEEETKQIATGAEMAKASTTANPSDSKPPVEPEIARREAIDAFSKRIKEPEAAIVVSVQHRHPSDPKSPVETWRGVVVNGCILLPDFIQEDEFIQVGDKQLPQRQIGITQGGLYVYHRQRLPQGYTKAASDPLEGARVWLVTPLGGGRNANVGAQVISPNENTKSLQPQSGREFLLESDGAAVAGAAVLTDDGEFLGVVKRSKGSLAVCESAASIQKSLQRTMTTPPTPANPVEAIVWLHDYKANKHWKGTIVRGVLVAPPEMADLDFSTLAVNSGLAQFADKLTKRHAVKVLGDRLALIWCEEVKPGYGLRDYRTQIEKDDFAFSDLAASASHGIPAFPDLVKRTTSIASYAGFASRVTEVRDKEFDLYWYRDDAQVGSAVFDPGYHLLGFNVAKSAEERAKLDSPNASSVVMASEVFRAIEEESKKLAAAPAPEKPAEKSREPEKNQPEKPKTESDATETPSAPPASPAPAETPKPDANVELKSIGTVAPLTAI